MENLERMNFEEFTNYVKENVGSVLPKKFADAKIDINKVTKNNGMVITGLVIVPKNQNICPTIYLENFYTKYEEGTDIQDVLKDIVKLYLNNIAAPSGFSNIGKDFKDIDFVKERVIMVVINGAKNEKLLSEVPYVEYEDLAIIFKVYLEEDNGGMATITIRNEHLAFWGVTKEELYEFAKKNTQVLLPVRVQSMQDVMLEMMGICKEFSDEIDWDTLDENPMIVISNKQKVNGASAIFYEDVLSTVAEKFGTDLYILPSSVHECIAVPYDEERLEDFLQMVTEINASQVALEEQLSNNVYYFNAETKTLKLA